MARYPTDPGLVRQVLDQAPGLLYVYDLVAGRNVWINPRWVEEFGYTLEETQDPSGAFLASILHPDDLPAVVAHHRALRETLTDQVRTLEYRMRRKSGEWVWLRSQDVPFERDPAGRVTRIIGAAHDITAERETEAARLHQETRSHEEAALRAAIIDSAVEGICVCEEIGDPPGIYFSLWNGRMTDITGYTVEEINRLGWYQTVYPDPATQARAADRMDRMRRGEDLMTEEWVITRKDGTPRTLLISTQVLVLPGQTPKVLGIMHDISERVALEARVRDADRIEAIGRLAGGVAHDFNNLLTSILGGASLLRDLRGLQEADRMLIEDIVSAAQRGADLTRQLLTFSRRQRPDLRPIDLGGQLELALRMVRRMLDPAITLETHLREGLQVNADPGMMDQVIMSLAVNARDAMPRGGTLRVSLALAPPDQVATLPGDAGQAFAMLTVEDTGEGIPDAVRPRVFEPFVTTKSGERGSGLGLATVYGIVTQHRGYITVESSAQRGTRFCVLLPLLAHPPAGSAAAARTPTPRLTVLVVEDLAPVRRITRRTLESLGHTVLEADSAEAALALWGERAAEISLLLSDVRLGLGLSGPELAEELRRRGAGCPMIMMSGYDQGLEGGQVTPEDSFLPKPFTKDSMAAAIARHFG